MSMALGWHMNKLMLLVLVTFFSLVQVSYVAEAQDETTAHIITKFHAAQNLEKGSNAPLIFLIGGSEGGIWPSDEKTVLDLQGHGYHVVTVAYFGLKGLPDSLSKIDLEPFGEAIQVYKKHKGVNSERIGIIGVSKGGELALILGSLYHDIHMVVGIVPSHVAFQGINTTLFHHSSWQYKGKEVSYVPYSHFSLATLKGVWTGEQYLDMHLLALEDKEIENKARIHVENINGPIFLLSAKHDQYWPSSYMSEEIIKRLKKYNFPYYFRHMVWDSNHWVLLESNAWDEVLSFIDNQFRPKIMRSSRKEKTQ